MLPLESETNNMASEAAPEIMILSISSQNGISDEDMSSKPDSLETNTEIVKAEMSFYTTPHSADYGEVVYYTLKNIETTCANDYAKLCSLPTPSVMSFEFMRRRVLAHATPSDRSDIAAKRINRIMEGKHIMSHGMHIPVDDTPEGPVRSRKLRGKCGGEREHARGIDDINNEEDRDRSSADDSNVGQWGPPPPPIEEDTLFEGSLGYGLMGDMCMYQNFENLAPSCQSSVADLHMLRSQYWEEESFANGRMGNRGRPHGMFVFLWVLIMIGFSLGIGISLRRRRLAKKDTRAILNAIRANPALAAQVEAESGVSLSSLGLLKGQKLPCTGLALFIKCMLIGITMHFVITLIGLISLTVVHLIFGAHPNGSPAAFAVLFLTAAVQIVAVVYGLHRVRRNAPSSRGSQPQEPTIATAVLFKAPNPEDGQNKSQSVEHNGPMMSFSTTTATTTTSSNATNGIFMTMRNAISGTAAPSAADGAYSILGTDDSVHGSHQKPMVYIGTPIVAHQPSATNWI